MRTTRQLLECRAARVLALASTALLPIATIASCTSTSVTLAIEDATEDASIPDTSTEAAEPTADDAGVDAPPITIQDAATSDARPPPIQCVEPPCATSLVIGNGSDGFCALLDDGTVACWGAANSLSTEVPKPERVPGLTNIVHIARTCALDNDGKVWCWGTGPFLRSTLRAYTTVSASAPVQLAVPAATRLDVEYTALNSSRNAPAAVGCALTADGVVCWGTNGEGQIRPRVLNESVTKPNGVTLVPMPEGGAPIEDIFVGLAAFALRTDGTLLSWGANPPLGRVSSLFPDSHPEPVDLAGVTYVDVAGAHACVVAQGSVYCWGAILPAAAQGAPLTHALPERVDLPELAVSVGTTAGDYGSRGAASARACAVAISGNVYCWGSNASGQAGDGTYDYAATPVKVKGLPGPASVVRTGVYTTCALLTTGKVYCWGDNPNGELGNGTIQDPSLVPVQVLLP